MTSPAQIPGSLSQSRLESLLESAKLLNSNLNIDELLGHLLRTVMGRYLIMRGVVAIRNGDDVDAPDLQASRVFDDPIGEIAARRHELDRADELAVRHRVREP